MYDESEDGKDEETTNLDSNFDIEAARWVVVQVMFVQVMFSVVS